MVRTSNRRLVCFWGNAKVRKQSKNFHSSRRKIEISSIMDRAKRVGKRPLCVEYSLYTKGRYKGLVKKKLKTGYL